MSHQGQPSNDDAGLGARSTQRDVRGTGSAPRAECATYPPVDVEHQLLPPLRTTIPEARRFSSGSLPLHSPTRDTTPHSCNLPCTGLLQRGCSSRAAPYVGPSLSSPTPQGYSRSSGAYHGLQRYEPAFSLYTDSSRGLQNTQYLPRPGQPDSISNSTPRLHTPIGTTAVPARHDLTSIPSNARTPHSASYVRSDLPWRAPSAFDDTRPAAMTCRHPSSQPVVMTLHTEAGVLPVPLNTYSASRAADEKRKRNAEASARFRQRRKEKDQSSKHEIDAPRRRVDILEQGSKQSRDDNDHLMSSSGISSGQDRRPDKTECMPWPTQTTNYSNRSLPEPLDEMPIDRSLGSRDIESSYRRRRLTEVMHPHSPRKNVQRWQQAQVAYQNAHPMSRCDGPTMTRVANDDQNYVMTTGRPEAQHGSHADMRETTAYEQYCHSGREAR